MSWRNRVKKASFRGVEFYVDSDELSTGRRKIITDIPGRDRPQIEDTGLLARIFPVSGYLIGEDYDLDRSRIIEACEKSGEGVLIHPRYGRVVVECESLRVSHEADQGGRCNLVINFIEAESNKFPTVTVDSVVSARNAARSLEEAAKNSFLGKLLTNGYPSHVLDAAAAEVSKIGDYLGGLVSPVLDKDNPVSQYSIISNAQALADFGVKTKQLINDAADVVASPITAFNRSKEIIDSVIGVYENGANPILNALRSLFQHDSTSTTGLTPAGEQIRYNKNAIAAVTRVLCISNTAQNAAVKKYETFNEAIDERDSIIAAIDYEEESDESGDLWNALAEIRKTVISSVPPPDLTLPRITEYLNKTTSPAIVISHRLYGTPSRDAEIIAHNNIQDPNFISGGRKLRVLTRA